MAPPEELGINARNQIALDRLNTLNLLDKGSDWDSWNENDLSLILQAIKTENTNTPTGTAAQKTTHMKNLAARTATAIEALQTLMTNYVMSLRQSLEARTNTEIEHIAHEVTSVLENKLTECIQQVIETKMTELTEKIEKSNTETLKRAPAAQVTTVPRTYANPSGRIEPGLTPLETQRIIARTALQDRQVLLDIIPSDPPYQPKSDATFKQDFNDMFKNEHPGRHSISAVRKLTNGGILLEMDSSEGAQWLRNMKDAKFDTLCNGQLERQKRANLLVTHFVPTSFVVTKLDLDENEGNPYREMTSIEELADENGFDAKHLRKMHWSKPIEKRAPGQKVATLVLHVTNVRTANQLIRTGLKIANKKVTINKSIREPLRCNKCQGYGHVQKGCTANTRCGNCAENHDTQNCLKDKAEYCINCNIGGHGARSRGCPYFEKKRDQMRENNAEITMPFFPDADDPFSWITEPTNRRNNPTNPQRPMYTGGTQSRLADHGFNPPNNLDGRWGSLTPHHISDRHPSASPA